MNATLNAQREPRNSKRPGRQALFAVAAVLVATGAVYLSSLTHDFIGMDDDVYVTANPLIASLAPGSLWAMLTRPYAEFYHPLTLLSLAIDHAVWGLNPLGYHLTDFLLHLLNTALVFWVCYQLVFAGAAGGMRAPETPMPNLQPTTRNQPPTPGNQLPTTSNQLPATVLARTAALIAAALFGLHPLHVESVAWAAQRKDLLCTFFYLLAFGCYLRHATTALPRTKPLSEPEPRTPNPEPPDSEPETRTPKPEPRNWYWLSVAAFLASLLSKSMGVTLPVVLILIDYYPLRRLRAWPGRRITVAEQGVWVEKIPFFALALLAAVATVAAQQLGGALRSSAEIPWSLRPWLVVHSYIFYLWRSAAPAELTVLYPLPHVGAQHAGSWIGVAVLLAITGAAWFLRRRLPALGVAWLYYVLTLAPVCGLLSFGAQSFADRYSYLPTLGPFLLLGVVVARINLIGDRGWRPTARALVGVAAGMALVLLARATENQIATWHNGESVWRHHLQFHPNHARARFNLANFYHTHGRIGAALRGYERCLALAPGDFNANLNYGVLLLRRGDATRAADHFRRAVEALPVHAKPRVRAGAHLNLGMALARLDQLDEAIQHFQRAVEIDPGYAAAHAWLGDAYARGGQIGFAIRQYTKALAIDPRMAQVHENLGLAWLAVEEPDKARVEFERTVHLRPRSPQALIELGLLAAAAGHPMHGLEFLSQAARYRRRDPMIHLEMARIVYQRGALALAESSMRAAVAADPDHFDARVQLGFLLEEKGDYGEALDQLTAARRILVASETPVPEVLDRVIRRLEGRIKEAQAASNPKRAKDN